MLRRRLKSKIVLAAVLLAAMAFGGGAYAATQSSPATARQDFLNDVAKRLNVTPAQLQSAITGAYQDQLNAAVKAGKLTQAQANAIQKRLQQHGGAPPFGFGFFGGGPGALGAPGNPGTPGTQRRQGPLGGPMAGLRAAATYLGLTDAQLSTQLRAGKTLAQIAQAQGKSVSGLEQMLLSALKTKLSKAVVDKRITSAQEQKALGQASTAIDAEVNGKLPGPGRFGGPGGGFGPRGAGGPGKGFGPRLFGGPRGSAPNPPSQPKPMPKGGSYTPPAPPSAPVA